MWTYPKPDHEHWRVAFARCYAEFAKVGLFEGKRIAAIVEPSLCMLPPADAVALLLHDPDVRESFLAMKGEPDTRGQPLSIGDEWASMPPCTPGVAPHEWMREFASTLVRLYPNTPWRIAEEVARLRCPLECGFDPRSAAEEFVLAWGAPIRVENAKPRTTP